MKIKPKRKFFDKLGEEVRDKIQVEAQKGEDHKGNDFKTYTKKYEKRKGSGKAVPKGQSTASKSTKPDLTLTGTMWRNLNSKSGDGFAEVGWTSKQQAQKVQGLIEGGRTIFSDRVHPKVGKLIDRMFRKEVKKNVKKSMPKDRTIRIGK